MFSPYADEKKASLKFSLVWVIVASLALFAASSIYGWPNQAVYEDFLATLAILLGPLFLLYAIRYLVYWSRDFGRGFWQVLFGGLGVLYFIEWDSFHQINDPILPWFIQHVFSNDAHAGAMVFGLVGMIFFGWVLYIGVIGLKR